MFPTTSSILALTLDPEPLSLPGRKQNKPAQSMGLPSNFSGEQDVMKIKPRHRRCGRGRERGQRKPRKPWEVGTLVCQDRPNLANLSFPSERGREPPERGVRLNLCCEISS